MKRKSQDGGPQFTRRALIIGALQGGLLAVLSGRLAWLQIVQGQHYRVMAENNSIGMRLLAPSRGLIVDRAGAKLALNGQSFRALVVPEQTASLETALSKLQKLIPIDQRDIQRVIKQAQRLQPFVPLVAAENLDWDEVSRIELNLPDLPGVSIDEGEVREYPLAEATAHVVGYVGDVSASELNDAEPILSQPGFKIGKAGIEKEFDEDLRGKAGTEDVEVNVVGREIRQMGRDPPKAGRTIALTLDAELQKFMQARLAKERSASAVVMDALSGEIYALASSPAFDPNVFSRGIPADMWEAVTADPGHPLSNKAVAGTYPPGSTFKMATALAALELGVINERTTQFCPGYYEFGNKTFHCWKAGGHGTVNVTDALTQSCDVFFYKISTDIGIDRLASYAQKLGLGDRTGIELPEERPGLFPTTAWKKEALGHSWDAGETIVSAIGQGYIQTTPLQLAVMTARIVNGGFAVRPRLAAAAGVGPQPPPPALGFKKRNVGIVIKGTTGAVNDIHGTAFSSRITDPDFMMGGKTGSAQVAHMTQKQRQEGVKNEDLPWELRDQALFVCYAPVDSPRYVCSVVVEHGVHGGSAAAPIAHDLMEMVRKRGYG